MKYILFITALLLAFAGCKKPTEDEPEIIYLPSSFDDYVLFPIGSWWVYKEENSGERDTLTVIKNKRYVYDEDIIEQAYMQMTSTYYDNIVEYASTASRNASSTLFYGAGAGPGGGGQFHVYVTGLINEQQLPYNSNVKYTYYKYDSLEIGTKKYYNIRQIDNKYDQPGGTECNEVFTNAFGIGVVQRKTCEGLIWNLIDYHINE